VIGAYVGVGVGGAALIVGGALGGVVLAERDDLAARCGGAGCTQAEIDSLGTMANASTGTLVGGGALLGLGLAGVLWHHLDGDEALGETHGLRLDASGIRIVF
jgi:hypothetical protein